MNETISADCSTLMNEKPSHSVGLYRERRAVDEEITYDGPSLLHVTLINERTGIGWHGFHGVYTCDWRVRNAKLHPWKRAPDEVFSLACFFLNQIISLAE